MVLFQEDFIRENAFIDTECSNLSFVKMAIMLNKMGVRNNAFFLALHDRDLIGVDPYDLKDDSIELKQRIAYESKINPFYALRTLIRISASGSDGIPYVLNRANLAQAWCFLNSINAMLVVPRQTGKTIGSMALACIYLYIMGFKVKWAMFCKGIKLQNENVDRLKKLRDALPKWLVHQTQKDTNNKEGIAYDAFKTELMTFVAQSDKQAAGDLARGQSIAVQHWDEIAFFDNIALSFDQCRATMDAAGQQARDAGLPSAVLLTTTAGDIDDPRGRWCYRQVCDAMRFTEQLYDCPNRAALVDTLRTNSRNNMFYIEYSYKQLGRSEDWFNRVTAGKANRVVEMDYLNRWVHGTSASILPAEIIDKIQSSRKDPVRTTRKQSMLVRWYDDPEVLKSNPQFREKPYVIGCDTSDNVGRDFTTLCMVDPYDLHVVCTFKCNTTNLTFVAEAIMEFLRDFPRSIFIPERNKAGAYLIDYIIAKMQGVRFNPLERFYNLYYQNYTADTDTSRLDYTDGRVRQKFGFSTTKNSREMLYSTVFMTALDLVGDRLYDSAIIDEISGLTTKNGRIDHSEAGHDDLIISFLLACYFIIFASNHQLYGIKPDEFMCALAKDGTKVDEEYKRQQLLIKRQILELKQRVRTTSNFVVKQAYERELMKLINSVGDIEVEDNSFKSLDQTREEAKEEATANSGIDIRTYTQFF